MVKAGTARSQPRENRLPDAEYQILLPHLEPVPMPLGMAVYESGGPQGYVYFPTDSIVSLLYVLESGASTEIAVTGNEGLVGISLFMGGETTPSRAVVQSAGQGYRARAAILKKRFESGGDVQVLLLRFTQALITQMTQTAVCNRHHAVHQQLCRWLLLMLDRLASDEVRMTQELIAIMLGVCYAVRVRPPAALRAKGLRVTYVRRRTYAPPRGGDNGSCPTIYSRRCRAANTARSCPG
jgi:CRP-like cAMP-binding protein